MRHAHCVRALACVLFLVAFSEKVALVVVFCKYMTNLSNIYICPLPCQKKPLFIISSWWPGHPVIICVHIVCLDCSILTLVAFVGLHDDEVMTRVSSLTAQFILLGTFIAGWGGVLDVLQEYVQNIPIFVLKVRQTTVHRLNLSTSSSLQQFLKLSLPLKILPFPEFSW